MPSILQSTNCYVHNNLYRLSVLVDDADCRKSTNAQSSVSSSQPQSADVLLDDIDSSLVRLSFQSLSEKKNTLLLKDIMLHRLISVQQAPLVRYRHNRNFQVDDGMINKYTTATSVSKQSRLTNVAKLNTMVSPDSVTQTSEVPSHIDSSGFYSTETFMDMEATSVLKTIIRITYMDVSNSIRWKLKKIKLQVESEEQANELYVNLNMCLSTIQQRPRRLLVFVNPFGGKGKARRIFERTTLPLFKEAGILVKAVFTERAGQAKDYIMKEDLNDFDGIICVGGDGMFAELCNGLLLRTASEANLDVNDPEVNIIPAKLRIGIIPAGSTDAVVYGTTGLNDPVTSTLQIIAGESLTIDLATVHNEKGFVRFMAAMLGYGFFGNIIQLSDKWRCLGPLRYDLAGLYQFLCNRSYHCKLTITQSTDESLHTNHTDSASSINNANPHPELPQLIDSQQPLTENDLQMNENHQTNNSRTVLEKLTKPALTFCRKNCEKCSSRLKNVSKKTDPISSVKREGKFTTINCLNMPCRSAKSKFGISPFTHLGDGSSDLILVKRSWRGGFLRFLVQIASDARSIEDLPHVERFCTNDVLITPVHSSKKELGNWQIDGELVHGNEMRVRVHRQVLKLFASGIQIDKVEEYTPKKMENPLKKFCPCLRRRKDKSQTKHV